MLIIYLIDVPFSKRDYERLGPFFLKQEGFHVEIWELTPIIRSWSYNQVTIPDNCSFPGHKIFISHHEFINLLHDLPRETLFISFLSFSPSTYFVFKNLSILKLPYCTIATALPMFSSLRFCKRFRSFIKGFSLSRFFYYFFKIIPWRFFSISEASYALVLGGSSALSNLSMNGPRTKVLPMRNYDYDLFIQNKIITRKQNNIAVFLDEYLPFHPDIIHLRLKPYVTVDQYFPSLRIFFDFIESKFKIKIIIAAHPRSHYESLPDYFGGREIIRMKTVELVRDADFVMTHFSTSLNFAILFNKPLIFLTSNALIRSDMGENIRSLANWLGNPLVNLNHSYDDFFIPKINEEKYHLFIKKYIKFDSSDSGFSWKIFSDTIKNNI